MRLLPPTLAAVLCAIAGVAVPTGSASAQSLSVFGGWDDDGSNYNRPRNGTRPPAQSVAPDDDTFFGFNTPRRQSFPAIMQGGPRPEIAGRAPPIVPFATTEEPGTILIDNEERRLYYVLSETEAYEYPISVGRDGFTWTGTETVSRVADWPDWHPPAEMRERDPGLPEKMYGGIKNPLGVKALFLGNTLYRIHGTNDPKTIGYAASSGCFRMMNEHVVHLASLVDVGTVVKVMDRVPRTDDLAERSWEDEPSALGAGSVRGTPRVSGYDRDLDVWTTR